MKGELTVEYAKNKVSRLANKRVLTDDEKQILIEMTTFLAENNPNPEERAHDILYLGGIYYEDERYDLALKYYEMAESMGLSQANTCLGYIWYYGRTGVKNYEKAFYYFSQAAKDGDINCAYKLADMYKNGYYVEADYEKYKSIIKELYPKVRGARNLFDLLPEVYTRLAGIYVQEGRTEDAIDLYIAAKDFLAQRIVYNPFFGNFTIMKYLIRDLRKLLPIEEDDVDFYDLYEILKKPATVTFYYKKKPYTVRSVMEDDECVVEFEGKWFRTADDFITKAVIGSLPLHNISRDLYMFNVRED